MWITPNLKNNLKGMFYMIMKKWNKLPDYMKTEEVKEYYELLRHKTFSLIIKRLFDIILSLTLLIFLSPVLLIIAIYVKLDSEGSIFFLQKRVTAYGKVFKIIKFRTMVSDAEKLGTQVTVSNDARVTKIGKFLRKTRLDELPQLINILVGDMTLVGTRPEVEKFVKEYTNEMYATLLLPAGVTSLASIKYKDEEKLLDASSNPNETYINNILPEKMKYNLEYMRKFNFFYDIKTIIMTVYAVFY